MSSSSAHASMSQEHIQEVARAVGCSVFNTEHLDVAYGELSELLSIALGGLSPEVFLPNEEENRMSIASSFAFFAALNDQKEYLLGPDDLECLMLGADFLDEDDTDEVKLVKGVVLDVCISDLIADVEPAEAQALLELQAKLAVILQRYGYGGQHFLAQRLL